MLKKETLKQRLETEDFYFTDADLDHAHAILSFIEEHAEALNDFPGLKDAPAFLTVDKGAVSDD